MPQVRHGGSGNASVAIVGSKFDGTGLVNEQIEQIHVPRSACGCCARLETSGKGLGVRETGDEEDDMRPIAGDIVAGCCLKDP